MHATEELTCNFFTSSLCRVSQPLLSKEFDSSSDYNPDESLDESLMLHCYTCSIILIMTCFVSINSLRGEVEIAKYVLYSTIVAPLGLFDYFWIEND